MRPTNRFLWTATVLLGSLSASSAQPLIDHVDVFASGSEGYHTFRIPAVVRAPDGSLLAFVEGRKENRRDPGGGDIDLVAKRSKDRGASWSPLQIVDDPGEGWSASNPTPVVEQNSGRVLIVYNRWEPGFGTVLSQPGTDNNQVWLRYSDDHGGNWSEPREITREAKDHVLWTGPKGPGRLNLVLRFSHDEGQTFGRDMLLYGGFAAYSDLELLDDGSLGVLWERGLSAGYQFITFTRIQPESLE